MAEVHDRHADLADLALGQRRVRVVPGLGGQVEGDRQPGLALGQVRPVQLVRRAAQTSAPSRCASSTGDRGPPAAISPLSVAPRVSRHLRTALHRVVISAEYRVGNARFVAAGARQPAAAGHPPRSGRHGKCLDQTLEVGPPRDGDGAERGEVGRRATGRREADPGRRRAARPGRPARPSTRRCRVWNIDSPGEEPADGHAVEPAGQRALGRPRLDAVDPAQVVQTPVGGDDLGVDPAAGPRRIGAGRAPPRRRRCRPAPRTARSERRNERLTRRPSRGRTPRGSGDHHPSRPPRPTGIGNSPWR